MSKARAKKRLRRHPLDLMHMLRDGARIAHRANPERFPDPVKVSQRAWNRTKHQLWDTYDDVPNANELWRQLNAHTGLGLGWRQWLEIVCSERDLKAWLAQANADPPRTFSPYEVHFGMNIVACTLGSREFFKHDYEATYDHLRNDPDPVRAAAFRRVLPSWNQAEFTCGRSTDTLYATADITRPDVATARSSRSLPIPEAIALFFARFGYLPTYKELLAFAHGSFKLGRRRNRYWSECTAEGILVIRRQALPEPPPYGTRSADVTDWVPLDVDVGGPLTPPLVGGRRSRLQVIANVREFLRWVQDNDKRIIHKAWREFSRGRPDVVSLNVIIDHGGLQALCTEARREDWRERALAWQDPRKKTPEQKQRESVERAAHSSHAEEIVAYLASRSTASATEISEALHLHRSNIITYLKALRKAGRVEPTETQLRSKRQRYRLTGSERAARTKPLRDAA